MKGLSNKEIEVIADLEFRKKYFFTIDDIKTHFDNKRQIVNTIYLLRKKGRIIKINRNKYYLVPIKARSGSWTEHPFIIADEIFNSSDYFIGGWSAAGHWKLTDQIPMQTDIYTTRRQGKKKILNSAFIFHRTTRNRIDKAVKKSIGDHSFFIQNKKDSRRWIRSRD